MNLPSLLAIAAVVAAALLWRATSSALCGRGAPILARPTKVVDGDSLRFGTLEVRLRGIDAPEWDQPGGSEASAALRAMIGDRRVLAFLVGDGRYGRVSAHVFVGIVPVSVAMAWRGHAWGDEGVAAFAAGCARVMRRGLWRKGGIHPRQWRLAHPKGGPRRVRTDYAS